MRRPECRIKQHSSHTIFVLSAFIWELEGTTLKTMIFTNQELAAILRLAHAMANSDGKVSSEETMVIVNEMSRFGVDQNKGRIIAELGSNISHAECCRIVSNMNAEEKRYVTAFLGTLICVDGDIQDSEMKLWSLVSALCDLPTMNIMEAVNIMANL